MKNYNIFFDTNSIKKIDADLSKFELNKTYDVIKNFITENELKNLKVFIPKIVIDELVQQYIQDYKDMQQKVQDELTKISVDAARLNWEIIINKNFDYKNREYIEYIKNKANEFLNEESSFLNIVEYPNESKLSKILNRALLKKRPFFGGNIGNKKFSDAGFKDVVFLESVVEFIENLGEDFFIVSKDKFFTEIDLAKEIPNSSGQILNYETGKEIIQFLKLELSIDDYSRYIKFVKSQYYKEAIEGVAGCKMIDGYVAITKVEEGDDIYVNNTSLVEIGGKNKEIIVKLSEENDLMELIDKETDVVMYEW